MYSDGHSETNMVPENILQFSVLELHNSMVSPPEESVLKDSKDVEIILSSVILQ